MTVPTDFAMRVYAYTLQIPRGKISTYKLIATAAGNPDASRAVGTALSTNPYAPTVPCHRVISTSGAIGGFFGTKEAGSANVKKKEVMLSDEGVVFKNGKLSKSEMSKYLFTDFKIMSSEITPERIREIIHI